MPHFSNPLHIRYAALSDIDLVRDSNQDTVYAGSRLLAVVDGFGASGAHASTVAIDVLKDLDADATIPAGALLNALHDAVHQAYQAIHDIAEPDDSGQMGGTTLTAMLWTGSQLVLVHIGDSPTYLLRRDELFQITHDHTFVQSMVDEGRLSPAEAAAHPQRSLLLRALNGRAAPVADVGLPDVQPADRYLLCSDGLSAVVSAQDVQRVVSTIIEPQQVARELVVITRHAGAPDNVSCVVADVTELRR